MGNKSFDINLRELAAERNLSARQVASSLGLPQKTVSEWFNGSRIPRDLRYFKILADYFGVSVHRIMYGSEDERSLVTEPIEKWDVFSGIFEISVKRVKVTRHEN
jgi:transcriptional regulator with XRE-family HTH domain